MTIRLLIGEEIRTYILRILSGECLVQRRPNFPELYILSPWISDVIVEFVDLNVLEGMREEDRTYHILDYNIKSINLAHALLLLKLHGGARINIVTLPLNEMGVSPDYLQMTKKLLDFLDEIGCNIFTNSKLHSKLLLANDLALLGSFNLTSSALYYRKEIGVSIDDLSNLDALEKYCLAIIHESEPYGYSSLLNWGHALNMDMPIEVIEEKRRKQRNRITRGWLLDKMVYYAYPTQNIVQSYGEFLYVTGGYDKQLKSYAQDLNSLYFQSFKKLLLGSHLEYQTPPDCEQVHNWVKTHFEYKGDESSDSLMDFLYSKFARKKVPYVKLRIKSLLE